VPFPRSAAQIVQAVVPAHFGYLVPSLAISSKVFTSTQVLTREYIHSASVYKILRSHRPYGMVRLAGISVVLGIRQWPPQVRYLNNIGVELNARNDDPLCRACDGGHLDIVRYLHHNGSKHFARNNEPLCRAAAAGHVELVSIRIWETFRRTRTNRYAARLSARMRR
jgi:hypothetical protein